MTSVSLTNSARVAFRQFRRERHRHQRRVLGARGRLELDQALVLHDWRVIEKHALKVRPDVRLLVALSQSALARRANEREAQEGLPSGDRSRHRSASIPGVGFYWSHSNSE